MKATHTHARLLVLAPFSSHDQPGEVCFVSVAVYPSCKANRHQASLDSKPPRYSCLKLKIDILIFVWGLHGTKLFHHGQAFCGRASARCFQMLTTMPPPHPLEEEPHMSRQDAKGHTTKRQHETRWDETRREDETDQKGDYRFRCNWFNEKCTDAQRRK